MKTPSRTALALAALTASTALPASETITYTYDALGRLVNASTSGTVNNGLTTSTAYDPAGNRSSRTVSGGSGGGGMAMAPAASPIAARPASAGGGGESPRPCPSPARAARAAAPDPDDAAPAGQACPR